ncbi:MAG TPA: DUF6612 family protein [Pseudogracilibacillus sp.]|nr:DUF6612 family protein [Pseudogracilibacillus sp.]
MKKNLMIIVMTSLFIITACNQIEVLVNDNNTKQDAKNEEVINDKEANNEQVEADEEVEKEEVDQPKVKPSDLRTVLEASQEAMAEVESGLTRGVIEEETSMAGVKEKIRTELEGEFKFEPLVYHSVGEANSDVEGKSTIELYVTPDHFYAFNPEAEQWMKLDNMMTNSETMTFINEDKINIILNNIDEFELNEKDNHFIISYIGGDEAYKDLVHHAILDTGEVTLVGQFGEMYEGLKESMEVIGGLNILIDKNSFLINKIEINYDMTMDFNGMKTNTIHNSTTSFSAFNKLDELVIPNEIMENAFELTY